MHSADKANRTNIRLAREQRAWEEKMSNTAVGRRARDLESSGFNRLLAATGPGASTPSVSAPTVEPIYRPGEISRGAASAAQALAIRANLQLTGAQTDKTEQEARSLKIDTDIKEQLKSELLGRESIKIFEEGNQAQLRTAIMQQQHVSSAADAERKRKSIDELLTLLKQQVEKGELDLKMLRNVASAGGLDEDGTIKLILDYWRAAK